ncbi:GerMN domain-containing protein [Fusibacter sp. JL216-2]|uniref:GerMN domain-containing protein n=1 Tax=Fusibacter sp. JL216-2 TaxID=3071453 RepID=UPI003D353C5B
MSRILANIILVLIIAFTVSAVPINTEILNLNISFPEAAEEETEPEESPVLEEATLDLTYENFDFDYLYNPDSLNFKFVGTSSLEADQVSDFTNDIQLEIYQGSTKSETTIVKRLQNSDLKRLISTDINGDVVTLTIKATLQDLNLKSGHYTLTLSSESDHLRAPLDKSLQVTYYGKASYKGPQESAARGKRLITMYFTDKSRNYLVPISREISYSGNLIRTTLNALRDGPSEESGLSSQSPAPYIPVARFSSSTGTVTLHTNSHENKEFTTGTDDTYLMMHSLINTMTHIENVSSVKFSVDNRTDKPLNGFDLSKRYNEPKGPEAYMGLHTETDHLYLTPVEVEATSASEMLAYLKNGVDTGNDLYPPVISSIDIVEESLDSGVLTLKLSDEIQTAYDADDAYARLMMDSIVYSTFSIEGVEKLIIITDSMAEGELHGYTLGRSFEPSMYLNIE